MPDTAVRAAEGLAPYVRAVALIAMFGVVSGCVSVRAADHQNDFTHGSRESKNVGGVQ